MSEDVKTPGGTGSFRNGLAAWEKPFDPAAPPARATAGGGHFLRGLEAWERPFGRMPVQEVVLVPAPGLVSTAATLVLRVKARVEILFESAGQIWSGAPVFLGRVSKGLIRAAKVDARNRASFDEMEPGEYRILTSPIFGSLGRFSVALIGAPATGEATITEALVKEFDSLEHRLHASITVQSDGIAELRFTTENPALAGTTVRFAFTNRKTGRIEISGEGVLLPATAETGQWAFTWRYRLPSIGGCELMFSVETSGDNMIDIQGVMVLQMAFDGDGNLLPVDAEVVVLHLEKRRRNGGSPVLLASPDMPPRDEEFDNAMNTAFSRWPLESDDVVWRITGPDGRIPADLRGPSLGFAFGVGLALLLRENRAGNPQPHVGAVARKSFAQKTVVSGGVATGGPRLEDLRILPVGGIVLKAKAVKTGGCDFVVSPGQALDSSDYAIDAGPRSPMVLRAGTVGEAIDLACVRLAGNVLEI